ncbi:unnamed protein product [Agarophyton chilense]|eukprot:gb/GEZJ01002322.1/.p1 GENE.gb/GEZJ01002322.1/~~gb/GEZJ01002322.1/.p1  ORF type:complete len:1118 (-),score=176.66 gb/GEZJ01002322.1/:1444-4575(-)
MSQPDRRLFSELSPDTDPSSFPSQPLSNPMPPPASAPVPPQHPLVSLATAAHKKPRKPQPRRPRPKSAAPTLLPAPAPSVSAQPPQLPHHISQHPAGHMFIQSHPALFQQQFPQQPQPQHPFRAALLPHQQKMPLQTQPQQLQQQQRQHRPQHHAFLHPQASVPSSRHPSPSPFSRVHGSDPNVSPLHPPQQQNHRQQATMGGDPRLAQFDAATLEQVLRGTRDPQIYATLSKQLNYLRGKPDSSIMQARSSDSPFSMQINSRASPTPLASSQPNMPLGASASVSQSAALYQRQQLLQKQQLYNQHHLNPQRPQAHDPNSISTFPFNPAASQDSLTASLSQNIANLPPQLQHHLQAQLQSRQLQAQQHLQIQKSKANSSHSQASQATHSNSTSRRRSPSNKRPPRQSPKRASIGVSDVNGAASSTSGAPANPNHAMSQSFEDTQSIGSTRQTELPGLRTSDPARNASQFLPSSAMNPVAQVYSRPVQPDVPVSFEIDAKKIEDERKRVLHKRELRERATQKKRRLQARPMNDYLRVHNPDYTTPFQGLVDAFERIVPFHVLLPPEDSSVSSEEWKKHTDVLSEKYGGFYKKLRAHCDRLHDSNYEAIGEETVLGQSSLTTEDSILMERILLDDYTETVRREAALARRRTAEAEAKRLEELNRQRHLLSSERQEGLSVSGALSPSQSSQIPQLPQNLPLHPGPGHSFQSMPVKLGVSNGSVSASHDIVSAGAQAALWRQATPCSSQIVSGVQNSAMAQANSVRLTGADATRDEFFETNNSNVARLVNREEVAPSRSQVFLGNRTPEQLRTEQYVPTQPGLGCPGDSVQDGTLKQKIEESGSADGMIVGQVGMGDHNLVDAQLGDAIQMTTAGGVGSQLSAEVEQNGENQLTLATVGSDSGMEDSSSAQNGSNGQDVETAVVESGLFTPFNNDTNVGLNGNENLSSGKRNGVSSDGTPQSYGLQDGVNVTTGSIDESLEGGDNVGENVGLSQIVLSGEKSNGDEFNERDGENEAKQNDSNEMKKDNRKQEVGALAMGSLLNGEDR